ncbi:MAG: hypothetical protein H7319_02820 [Spirosoma sp.]|nr:hypothetical protein [Spirosoma sp.]
MIQEAYKLQTDSTQRIYFFESTSPERTIKKVIQFEELVDRPNLPSLSMKEIYNIGFGDVDDETGEVSDTIDSKNGDKDKVLRTVALSVLKFLNAYPTVAVYAEGSTKSRIREYQMSLSRSYDELVENYVIHGLLKDGSWSLFERNINYYAFVVYRR